MLFLIILFYVCNFTGAVGDCLDIHSHVITQGMHYVPGPNTCKLCICDKGGPKYCKSILCSQPDNCKSYERGDSCCDFKCRDDVLTKPDYSETYDLALRLIASAITAILSLSLLFFLIHRLRQRKIQTRRNQQLNEEQNLNSIGYIASSLGYLPGNIGYLGSTNHDLDFHYDDPSVHFPLWKPPGNYFPRGEAPPTYEEVIRLAHVETEVISNQMISANSMVPANNLRNENVNVTLVHNTNVNIAPNLNVQQSNVIIPPSDITVHQPVITSHQSNINVQQNIANSIHLRHDTSFNQNSANAINSEVPNQEVTNITIQNTPNETVAFIQSNDRNKNANKKLCENSNGYRQSSAAPITVNVRNKESSGNQAISVELRQSLNLQDKNTKSVLSEQKENSKQQKTETESQSSKRSITHVKPKSIEMKNEEPAISVKNHRYENLLANPNLILKNKVDKDKYYKYQSKENQSLICNDKLNEATEFQKETFISSKHRSIPQHFSASVGNFRAFSSDPCEQVCADKENVCLLKPRKDTSLEKTDGKSYENKFYSNGESLSARKENLRKNISSHRTLPKNLRELNFSFGASVAQPPVFNHPKSENSTLAKNFGLQVETPLALNLEVQALKSNDARAKSDTKKYSYVNDMETYANLCLVALPDSQIGVAGGSKVSVSNKIKEVDDREKEEKDVPYLCPPLPLVQDDLDDYRSECENCKISSYPDADEEGDCLNETMTLQRRPLEQSDDQQYYRTSLTLPTNTKKTRCVTPCVIRESRESWFLAMQGTSSSSESE